MGWVYHTTAPSGGAGDEIRIWGSSANDNILYTHAYAPWIKRDQFGASSIHARMIGVSLGFLIVERKAIKAPGSSAC